MYVYIKIIGLCQDRECVDNKEQLKIYLIDNYSDYNNRQLGTFVIKNRSESLTVDIDDNTEMIISPIGVLVNGTNNLSIDSFNIEMKDGKIIDISKNIVGGGTEDSDTVTLYATTYTFDTLLNINDIKIITINGKIVYGEN